MNRIRQGSWLLVGLTLVNLGCSKGDSERLGRLAHKLAGKAEAIRQETNNRLHTSWQPIPAHLGLSGLGGRVMTRIRWDKDLAAAPIQVETQGTTVILKGAVADLDRRNRAVGLAQTTVGVEQAIDQLQAPGTE